MTILLEDSRQQLLTKAKSGANYKGDKSKGKNRYARRTRCNISSSTKEYNNIDMNKFFSQDILDFSLIVHGENHNNGSVPLDYSVRLSFSGVVDRLKDAIQKNNGKFEFKVIVRSLIDTFNRGDVYVYCSCLHKDTKIKLLDGTAPTVSEMLDRYNNGESLYVYSVDSNGDFAPGVVEKVWITGERSDFIEVTLDNDQVITTTPEHLYMLRDGNYLPASELTVGQSLMPLYFNEKNGYELVKKNSSRGWSSTYKEVANYFKKDEIELTENRATLEDGMNYLVAIHHKDFNKKNNTPENLQIMTAREHWDYHSNFLAERRKVDKEFDEKLRNASHKHCQELNANPTKSLLIARENWQERGRLRNYDLDRRQQQSEIFRKSKTEWWANLTQDQLDQYKQIISENKKNDWKQGKCYTDKFKAAAQKRGEFLSSQNIQSLAADGLRKRFSTMSKEEKQEEHKKKDLVKIEKNLMRVANYGGQFTLDNYRKYKIKYTPDVLTYFDSIDSAVSYFQLNHKIKSIRHISLDNQPVYDIKVKDFNNFLVDSGVILHNCPDFHYRIGYWASVHNIIIGTKETRPSNKTNPNDTAGPACKHICLVLQNMQWIYKVAAVINNYTNYMESHYPNAYKNVIYPALYGKEYEGDKANLKDKELGTDVGLIKKAHEYGSKRGQFQKGNTMGIRFAKETGEPIPDETED